MPVLLPNDLKILVIGDIMLDKYVIGEVERISPEAPVPIVKVTSEYYSLGGCGNVVQNLKSIGVGDVSCFASIGYDEGGAKIRNKIRDLGVRDFLFHGGDVTTVKERIVAGESQTQMLRVDREEIKPLIPAYYKRLIDFRAFDIIIISDYAKGIVNPNLIDYIKNNNKYNNKIIIDPKPKNIELYNKINPYMLTPNEKEYNEILSKNVKINSEYILETKGKNGMILHSANETHIIHGKEVPVYNVSGCGDVVTAVVSLCIAMGIDVLSSSKISNKCAGFTATLPGTSLITQEKFDIFMNDF